MSNFLITMLAFIIGLGVLITFHELGHFLVARRCGVKILCFSIGFGKALVSRKAKNGTEYRIAMLPLGGYVKMLGERNEVVAPEEKAFAFNQKSVWARIAIVFAGPAFNFIFAFFAYMAVAMIGVQGIAPFIGVVQPHSIADKAGLIPPLEIVAINDKPTSTWKQVLDQITPKIGDKDSLKLSVHAIGSMHIQTYLLALNDWQIDAKHPDLIGSLGIEPLRPEHFAIINSVVPKSAAEKAGLLAQDHIIAIAGMPIHNVNTFISEIERRPSIKTEITVVRGGDQTHPITLFITPDAKIQSDNRLTGHIGVTLKPMVFPKEWIRSHQYSFWKSFKPAYEQTVYYTKLSFNLMGKMIVGKLSPSALSGPISIAQGAGMTFKMGFQYYLSFLALISISLGVINLLPIPLLDGGHLFFYLIEIVIRRPVPQFIQEQATALGILIIAGLMVVSFYNDIMRLF